MPEWGFAPMPLAAEREPFALCARPPILGPRQFCLSWGRASLHLSSSGQESRCWSWDYKQMLSGPVCKHTVFQWGSRVFSSPRQQLLPFTPNPSSWPALRVPVPPGLAWGLACGDTCPDAY